MALLAGADGCNGGWVVATQDGDSADPRCCVVNSIAEILQSRQAPDLVAIDVPIGIPDSGPRRCDLAARKALRDRRSSVFPVPIRAMLQADSYEEACRAGRAVDGRALSRQCWSILPKILEVDRLLRAHPDVRDRVSEVHPEVSFWALAGRPMVASKKSRKGQIERLELLEPIFGGALQRAITGCRKDGAKADDVLDAFVALWSAERIYNGSAVALPEECEIDRFGMGMQIFA